MGILPGDNLAVLYIKRWTMSESSQDVDILLALKSTVLNLDWEISDQTLAELDQEVVNLQAKWAGRKLLLIYLQILDALCQYINGSRENSHPGTFVLLKETFSGLEQVVENPEMDQAEKNSQVMGYANRYNELKKEIAAGDFASRSSEEMDEKQSSLDVEDEAEHTPDTVEADAEEKVETLDLGEDDDDLDFDVAVGSGEEGQIEEEPEAIPEVAPTSPARRPAVQASFNKADGTEVEPDRNVDDAFPEADELLDDFFDDDDEEEEEDDSLQEMEDTLDDFFGEDENDILELAEADDDSIIDEALDDFFGEDEELVEADDDTGQEEDALLDSDDLEDEAENLESEAPVDSVKDEVVEEDVILLEAEELEDEDLAIAAPVASVEETQIEEDALLDSDDLEDEAENLEPEAPVDSVKDEPVEEEDVILLEAEELEDEDLAIAAPVASVEGGQVEADRDEDGDALLVVDELDDAKEDLVLDAPYDSVDNDQYEDDEDLFDANELEDEDDEDLLDVGDLEVEDEDEYQDLDLPVDRVEEDHDEEDVLLAPDEFEDEDLTLDSAEDSEAFSFSDEIVVESAEEDDVSEDRPSLVCPDETATEFVVDDVALAELDSPEPDENADCVEDLQMLLLSVEWEVDDRLLHRLEEEVESLRVVLKDNPVAGIHLNLLGTVIRYIAQEQADVISDSMTCLKLVADSLESFVRNETRDPSLYGEDAVRSFVDWHELVVLDLEKQLTRSRAVSADVSSETMESTEVIDESGRSSHLSSEMEEMKDIILREVRELIAREIAELKG